VAARSDRWSRSWPRIILSAGLAGGFDQWEAAVRDGLQSMRDRGDLRRKADPGRLAVALLAAVQGGTLLAQLRRGPSHLETALDEVLDRIEDLRPKRAQLRQ
jgi:TetR/AcrR family transcriptional regulator, transcriptional repressor for nem operon